MSSKFHLTAFSSPHVRVIRHAWEIPHEFQRPIPQVPVNQQAAGIESLDAPSAFTCLL